MPVQAAIRGYAYSGMKWRYEEVVAEVKSLRRLHVPEGTNTQNTAKKLEQDLRELGSRALSLADDIRSASDGPNWSPYNL
jgi:hypothetical protein